MRASASPLAALLARPIAHRGLHDAARGVIENSRAAVAAAMAAGFGVEVDIQLTADGAAVVFHDYRLDRLTEARGPVEAHTAAELTGIGLLGSAAGDCIWRLEDLLAEVGGRVPLVIEMKTLWNGDARLATLAVRALSGYTGPVALKSFDPLLIRAVRAAAPHLLRGIIGCGFNAADWPSLPAPRRRALRNLLHWPLTRPHFLSWDIDDLPRGVVSLAHRLAETPVMTWTVTSPAVAARARTLADQIVFQDFVPRPTSSAP
jgi:glycerophosphoryl diester phosphodiesterase